MPRTSPLALAIVLALASAASADGFTTRLGEREVGREEVQAAQTALVSSATLRVIPDGEPFRYEQRTEVDPAGALVRYRLASNTHEVIAEVTSSGVALEATVMGQRHQKMLAGPGPWVILDNLVFAHYDLLGRAMIAPDAPARLNVLVPQALVALPATCTSSPGAPVRVGGEARDTRELALQLANVRVLARVDAATGAAYRVEIPSQRVVAVRDGVSFDAAPAAPAPSAPRLEGREVEVSFPAPGGEVPGTLTLPEGEGPWPAVVLLHGSGPHDRDETIGPNKPLRDVAWQLAARGVASLRYDKRTYLLVARLRDPKATAEAREEARAALRDMTLEQEVVEDGVAAARWLAARPEVGPVFVAGHSLGGMAAPLVARATDARGVIVLAGPGRPMKTLLREQLAYQATLLGKPPEEAAAAAEAQLAPLGERGEALADDAVFMGAPGRYWKDLLPRDPAADLAALELPALVIHAAEDCQVRVADHEALRAALAASPAASASRAVLLEGLNHLLMPVDGPSTGAEYHEPGRVSERVGDEVARWIRAVTGD